MERKKNMTHGYTIVENKGAIPPPVDVEVLEGQHDYYGEVAHNGIMRTVGEIHWINEEVKKKFTDSEGRLHSVGYHDPDTGEFILE